ESGTLRPTYFQYPGLYIYLLVGLYRGLGIVSTYGRQLAAAAVSAAGGLGIVAATAYAARAVAGPLGTVVATALAAASPMLLTESRTPAPDGLCVLFAALAIAATVRRPAAPAPWGPSGPACLPRPSSWSPPWRPRGSGGVPASSPSRSPRAGPPRSSPSS